MLNNIVLAGRLVNDPELRATPNGMHVASFTLAVDREYQKDKTTETDFIPCVAWRGTGEYICRNFIKGELLIGVGRLQLRDWTDKDGNKRRSAEVVIREAHKTQFIKKPKLEELPDGEEGELPF